MNFPEQWGIRTSLTDCVGKTIEKAEVVKMEYGCTWNSAWVVKFTDGSRAFFAGQAGTGVMNPDIEAVGKCDIFTPEEYGQMQTDKKRRLEARANEVRKDQEREFERLRSQLGK